jgi:hypothetical protein
VWRWRGEERKGKSSSGAKTAKSAKYMHHAQYWTATVRRGQDKKKRALIYQNLTNGKLGLPSLTARLQSAQAHWVAKLTEEQRPWIKLVVEHGVDWTKQEALSSVRDTHGVEGFLRECVTAWYASLSPLKPGGNALV